MNFPLFWCFLFVFVLVDLCSALISSTVPQRAANKLDTVISADLFKFRIICEFLLFKCYGMRSYSKFAAFIKYKF